MRFAALLAIAALPAAGALPSEAATVTFLNERVFRAVVGRIGLNVRREGFEDDALWGAVRSTVTAGRDARRGQWGVYSLPHGDFSGPDHGDDVPDGFGGSAVSGRMFAVGGWVRTNTPYAGISLLLDGAAVDFGDGQGADPTVLGTSPAFFGAIRTEGFERFLFQETEGTFEEVKYIFGDDFTIGFGPGTVALSTVPVPAAAGLLAAALAMLGGVSRRRLRTAGAARD